MTIEKRKKLARRAELRLRSIMPKDITPWEVELFEDFLRRLFNDDGTTTELADKCRFKPWSFVRYKEDPMLGREHLMWNAFTFRLTELRGLNPKQCEEFWERMLRVIRNEDSLPPEDPQILNIPEPTMTIRGEGTTTANSNYAYVSNPPGVTLEGSTVRTAVPPPEIPTRRVVGGLREILNYAAESEARERPATSTYTIE